jgi:predicted site-specific integrase-resolvase
MPTGARRLGTIWVDAAPADEPSRVVVYARVSARDQSHDLNRQVAGSRTGAMVNGHAADELAGREATAAGREAGRAGG